MLHIVSINTGHAELFARIGQGDAVIFIGDAVLALHKNATHNESLLQCCQDRQCYILAPDMQLRGLTAVEVLAKLTLLDYPEFVQLTIEYDVIKTWS
ncbi:MAG: tRNA 2-thiouridine synthesizing protein B [Methyloprofundus sp.]|nr:MAG: tRNA 2-thiouridine synthesizing protein B [Methyloprofundus sp.]